MADKKRITIAEDDKTLREVLAQKLEKNGYVVDRAEDGVVALEKMRANKPDLLLLDVLMPRKGGIEVFEDMSKDAALKNVPVIIISNSGQPVEMEKVRKLGARDFIIKAVFDPNEVLAKIKTVFEGGSNQSGDWSVRMQSVLSVPPSPTSNLTKSTANTMTETNTTKKFVLVVEDDKFLRELLVRKLATEGFDVENALDVDGAFAVLTKRVPDIIFLDLILPGVDGFEILARIKKDPKIANVPVVIFSNLGEKADIDKAMALGAKDFMVKANFTLDEIVTKAHSIVG